MNRKDILFTAAAYIVWGVHPLYWHMFGNYNPIFILADRIFFAALLLFLLLMVTRRLGSLWQVMSSRQAMRWLIPAALTIAFNWGFYNWAMINGHILDVSMGYYINPLFSCAAAIIFFGERLNKWQAISFALAGIGVVIATLELGQLPWLALVIALTFCIYSCLKKKAAVDPIISTAVESIIIAPLALMYIVFFGLGEGGLTEVTGMGQVLLLVGAGVVSALPLCLFARGVNHLPMIVVALVQYLSPIISMLVALLLGERLSTMKIICFIFIWLGLIVYTWDAARRERKKHHAPATTHA